MAARYWVGGSGTWNSTSTTNWSATSGGASGASAPTTADNVFFDNNSNSGTNDFTVTIGTGATCIQFSIDNLDGNMTLAGTAGLTCRTLDWNTSTFSAGKTLTVTYTGAMTFSNGSSGNTPAFDTGGVSLSSNLTFNIAGATWTLSNNCTTSGTVTLTAGSIDLSTYILTCSNFISSNSNTRNLTFGSGSKIVVTGTGATTLNMATITGYSTTGTGLFELTDSSSTARTISVGSTLSESNTFNISITAGTGTVTFGASTAVRNLDFTGFSGTLSHQSFNIYGNLTFSSGMTVGSAAQTTQIQATTGTQVITTNGKTLDFPITITNGGTRQLADALTMGSTRTLTFTGGTLDLQTFTLTCGSWASTSTNTRSITFGSGSKIVIASTSTATVFSMSTSTGFTYTGTPNFEITGAALAGVTRTISGQNTGGTESNVVNLKITAGADTLSFSSNGRFSNLEITSGFTGTITLVGNLNVYGNLDLLCSSATMTANASGTCNFLATSGTKEVDIRLPDFPIDIDFNGAGGTWQIITDFTLGRVGNVNKLTLTAGTLDLNSKTITSLGQISITGSTTRAINGPGTIATSYGATATVIVAGTTLTNFSAGGSAPPVIELTYSGSSGTRTIQLGSTGGSGGENRTVSIKVSAGTDTITISNSSAVTDLDYTGFSGTMSNNQITIFGNLTLSGTMTLTAGTNTWTFGATSGTKTITSNGETLDFPVTFNGAGGAWQLQDAFTHGATRTLTLTAGTFDANIYNVSANIFSSSGTGVRQIKFGSGTWTISGSGTSWDCSTSTNLTTTQGTATITMTSASAKVFAGGSETYPTLNQGGAGQLTISGSNTFANITNTVQPATVLFTSGTTQTFAAFSLSGTSGNLITIGSTTTSQHTLSMASGTVSVSFCSISYSNATGGASWQAYTTNGNVDGGNNTGWLFAAIGYNGYVGFFAFFN